MFLIYIFLVNENHLFIRFRFMYLFEKVYFFCNETKKNQYEKMLLMKTTVIDHHNVLPNYKKYCSFSFKN